MITYIYLFSQIIYSQTSVFERLGSQPIRFSTKNFEFFYASDDEQISVLEQTECT